MGLRSGYVDVTRVARELVRPTGLLDALERSPSPAARYVRSLFSVYDAEELARLDLPWWSYRAIRAVDRFLELRPGATVFEFGSGASTPWLARRAATVHTVEHDTTFVPVVERILEGFDNVELHVVGAPPVSEVPGPHVRSEREGSEHLDFSEYVATIDRVGGTYDLIVIDGRARVESLRRALPHVAADGAILFDDVERSRYAPALSMPGTCAHVMRGITPSLPFPTSTAILRPDPPVPSR
ncbi:MAG: class I SAM-dependent methyltransferase [Nitriliruptor sp.]